MEQVTDELNQRIKTTLKPEITNINEPRVIKPVAHLRPSDRSDPSDIRIIAATENHAGGIASWARSATEAKFVGSVKKKLTSGEVREWIENAVGAFLLVYKGEPVAFSNIATVPRNDFVDLEIGRALVKFKHRKATNRCDAR